MPNYDTYEEVAKLAETDPELAELLNSGPQGWAGASLEESAALLAKLPRPDPPPTPTDAPLDIPMRDGRLSRARVYTSAQPSSAPRALVIYVHGGGFVLGDPTHVAVSARAIAEATGAVVVAPSYRLAPAHRFPAAPDDIWDALAWLARPENATTLGADVLGAGLVLGGVSAGGNLAAAAAQRYVNSPAHKSVPLAGVLLVVPYLLEPELVPEQYRPLYFSREQNADALIVDRAAMDFVQRQAQINLASPLFSPFAAERPHEGMPPVYIQAAGQDPLRDDALVYERVLRDHGVKTRLDVYPGVPHNHLYIIPALKSASKAHQDLIKGAGWLLGKEVTDEEAAKALNIAAAAVPPPSLPRVN